MGVVNINGKTYSGSVVVINGDIVEVDGQRIKTVDRIVNVQIDGNIQKLAIDVAQKVVVNGQCHTVSTVSGDVEISGDVTGSVSTVSGDVECGDIGGSVSTISGDVN